MKEGWLSEITIHREATLLGSAAATPINPPGIRDAKFFPAAINRFARTDAWGNAHGGQAKQWTTTLQLTREFRLDPFAELLLEALRTDPPTTTDDGTLETITRSARKGTAAIPTFGATVRTADGRHYRLRGMVPTKIEWILQGRRAITEDTSWSALVIEDASALDDADSYPHAITPAHYARHDIDFTTAPWNPAESFTTPTFSCQLIFQREARAVAFTEAGQGTAWEHSGAWDILGKTETHHTPTLSQCTTGRTARLWWQIHNPLDQAETLQLWLPTATVKLSQQPLKVKGQVDVSLDFMATGGTYSTTQKRRI